jgi:hypothetical protein
MTETRLNWFEPGTTTSATKKAETGDFQCDGGMVVMVRLVGWTFVYPDDPPTAKTTTSPINQSINQPQIHM